MDQAILVALVMLVCVLTMLVLGIPISGTEGIYRRQFLLAAGNTLFHTGGEYHE